MTKVPEAEGFFDDGLTYLFDEEVKPHHIHLEVQTSDNQLETCDLRVNTINPVPVPTTDSSTDGSSTDSAQSSEPVLTQSPSGPAGYERKPDSDVVFFRLGYYNFMKLNSEPMIHETAADTWYEIDMLIDWNSQLVSIYVDGEGKGVQKFYIKRKSVANSVNAVSIYGLSPEGHSRIRNLQVCDTLCDNSK